MKVNIDLEFAGVLKDEDIGLLLSRSDDGGGDGRSWNELLKYVEELI